MDAKPKAKSTTRNADVRPSYFGGQGGSQNQQQEPEPLNPPSVVEILVNERRQELAGESTETKDDGNATS